MLLSFWVGVGEGSVDPWTTQGLGMLTSQVVENPRTVCCILTTKNAGEKMLLRKSQRRENTCTVLGHKFTLLVYKTCISVASHKTKPL